MSDRKVNALRTYTAAQNMLHDIAERVNSDPLDVFPSGMELTSGGSMDASFLASWNEQMLSTLGKQQVISVSTQSLEHFSMTEDDGFKVLVGFLGDYEQTLMSGMAEQKLLTEMRRESLLPIEDRSANGYWTQWLSFISKVPG